VCFALEGTRKSKRKRLAEAKEVAERKKGNGGQDGKGGGKGSGKGGNKGGGEGVKPGQQARFVDDTTDLGFLKLGSSGSWTHLKVDINKARKMLVNDHNLTAAKAELMCLPVLCDHYVSAGYCPCVNEAGHENAQSKYHHFEGIDTFKKNIAKLFALGGSRE
jgi:hypothetical protein